MSKVIFDISMSLDGFVTASDIRPDEPMGVGGQRLHAWAMGGDERGREILARGAAGIGAVIAGRRTYDTSLPWWGADGPTGPARLPLLVVTHRVPEKVPDGGVYRFVTDGIDSALRQARQAAGGKDVTVMGGADVARQFIRADLIDEIQIHLVPVLFGGGTRLFEHLGDGHIRLEPAEVVESSEATHLRYRVIKRSP
ncbi:dihydrofolate reductase family protein [Planomonospora alba]|uniref:Dihydrofolate reductase family protein n=1 Tax=Planomonospora alba TaxID=161354 RepID=A0ABP6MSJ0_9ACTN